jgi:hypothetical protein
MTKSGTALIKTDRQKTDMTRSIHPAYSSGVIQCRCRDEGTEKIFDWSTAVLGEA